MTFELKYACTSQIGKVRGNHEDNFWCGGKYLPAENSGTEGTVSGSITSDYLPAFAVFDGMGGESCGEIAAFLAAQEFGNYLDGHGEQIRKAPETLVDEICESMNQAVCAYAKENHVRSMGCTVVMAFFQKEQFFASNLGDSRIYCLREDRLYRVSTDHVYGGGLFGKAPLIQYLGLEEEEEELHLEPSLTRIRCEDGMRLLLCTDGLTDMVSDQEIENILLEKKDAKETVEKLLAAAMENGGRDNTTIFLCDMEKAGGFAGLFRRRR